MADIETESYCSKTSEISSYISEENDELTDDDKEFEESGMTDISDGTINNIMLLINFDSNNNKIILIYFRRIDSRFTSFTYESTPFNI